MINIKMSKLLLLIFLLQIVLINAISSGLFINSVIQSEIISNYTNITWNSIDITFYPLQHNSLNKDYNINLFTFGIINNNISYNLLKINNENILNINNQNFTLYNLLYTFNNIKIKSYYNYINISLNDQIYLYNYIQNNITDGYITINSYSNNDYILYNLKILNDETLISNYNFDKQGIILDTISDNNLYYNNSIHYINNTNINDYHSYELNKLNVPDGISNQIAISYYLFYSGININLLIDNLIILQKTIKIISY